MKLLKLNDGNYVHKKDIKKITATTRREIRGIYEVTIDGKSFKFYDSLLFRDREYCSAETHKRLPYMIGEKLYNIIHTENDKLRFLENYVVFVKDISLYTENDYYLGMDQLIISFFNDKEIILNRTEEEVDEYINNLVSEEYSEIKEQYVII